jgi:hypothetical protein
VRRLSPWAIWGLITVVVWCAWGWSSLAPLARRHRHWDDETIRLDQRRAAALTQLADAPRVVAQVDSVTAQLQRTIADFARVDSLTQLFGELTRSAHEAGVARVDAAPDLKCMINIPLHRGIHDSTGVSLDTLRLELSAGGAFGAIGAWLDRIEARPDFQQWSGCEWARGEEDGTVNFTGRAAFWVLVPTEQTP